MEFQIRSADGNCRNIKTWKFNLRNKKCSNFQVLEIKNFEIY